MTTTLPPRLESYGLDLKLALPYVSLQGTTRYYRSAEGADLLWDVLTLRATVGAGIGPTLSDQFIWDIEGNRPLSNTATFTWGNFRASLIGQASAGLRSEPGFRLADGRNGNASGSHEASASFRKEVDLPLFRKGEIRFKGSLNAEFSQSLLKATESVLALTYGLTLSIPGILDINISGTSQNSSVWRYAPAWFGMSNVDGIDVRAGQCLGRSLEIHFRLESRGPPKRPFQAEGALGQGNPLSWRIGTSCSSTREVRS